MKNKYAICYVSNVSKNIEKEQINKILNNSQQKNMEINITGVLLYSEGNFFQVIEGEEQPIKKLYSKIQKDDRHRNIFKIFEKKISIYKYDGYKSDFVTSKTKLNHSVEEYMQHIIMADTQTRNAVENILKLFIASY